MDTIESTVTMMRTLPEADLLKIQDFTKKLSERHEIEVADEAVGKFLPPKSREDIYRDLEISRRQESIRRWGKRLIKSAWNLEYKVVIMRWSNGY